MREIAYCPSLPTHSIETKNKISKTVVKAFDIPSNLGIVKSDGEKISDIKLTACPIFSDLKKIQANTVNPKVNNIKKNSLALGINFP